MFFVIIFVVNISQIYFFFHLCALSFVCSPFKISSTAAPMTETVGSLDSIRKILIPKLVHLPPYPQLFVLVILPGIPRLASSAWREGRGGRSGGGRVAKLCAVFGNGNIAQLDGAKLSNYATRAGEGWPTH